MFVPDNIDELSEGIVKKNLIPSKQEVEDKGKVKEDEYDPEKVKGKDAPENAKAAEEEEVDLEEVAKAVGTSKDALEKFIEAEGIKDKNQIKGIKPVRDIKGLNTLLEKDIPEQNPTVLVLKVKGPHNQDRGYIIDTDGNKLQGNEGNLNEVAEEIVPEHSCAEAIDNMADAKNTQGQEIDKAAYFNSKKEYIKSKLNNKLDELNKKDPKKPEYYTEKAEIEYEFGKEMEELGLEAETLGLKLDKSTQEVVDEINENINDAKEAESHDYVEAGKAEVVETAVDVGKTIAGVAGAAITTSAAIAGLGVKKITEQKGYSDDDYFDEMGRPTRPR